MGGSDRWLGVWDVAGGALRQILTGHSGLIMSLCFAGDSRTLASGGEDQVKLWGIIPLRGSAGCQLATLYPPAPQEAGKGLAADSRAITADAKGITADAKGLSADSRGLTADSRTVTSVKDYVVATPEGYYMGSASADRYAQFRLGQDSFPAESFQARYYRPDLVQQSLAGSELPPVCAFHGPVPPTLSFDTPSTGAKVSGSAATSDEMVKAILSANAGVLVLASSRGSDLSLENAEWGHGAFTKALLEAMSGQAAPPGEKIVATIDFIAYVSRRVKALTSNEQHLQVAFLQDFDGDVPIVAEP